MGNGPVVPPSAVAEVVRNVYTQNKATSNKGGIAISAVILGVFLLATAVTGYIGVQSNINNKCNDNTLGVKIATNKTSRGFMIGMIVIAVIMILAAFAGIGIHFGR